MRPDTASACPQWIIDRSRKAMIEMHPKDLIPCKTGHAEVVAEQVGEGCEVRCAWCKAVVRWPR